MKTGISLMIDYAFKRVFGIEKNKDSLIDLLNAIVVLDDNKHIQSIELLNPFNEKTYDTDKLSILDIKAKDNHGNLYDIEVQVSPDSYFPRRILYYLSYLDLQTTRDDWIYLLKHSKDIDLEHVSTRFRGDTYSNVLKELEFMSQTTIEKERYEARLKYQRDLESKLDDYFEKGKKEAWRESTENFAKKLKARGFSTLEISDLTGLSESEIEDLEPII